MVQHRDSADSCAYPPVANRHSWPRQMQCHLAVTANKEYSTRCIFTQEAALLSPCTSQLNLFFSQFLSFYMFTTATFHSKFPLCYHNEITIEFSKQISCTVRLQSSILLKHQPSTSSNRFSVTL